jgi:esterase/lipase
MRMTAEFGKAIEGILGIAFGGVILAMLAPHLNSITIIDLSAMAMVFFLAAIALTAVLTYAAVHSILS